MKPSRIRVFIIDACAQTQNTLADQLRADARMEVVGQCRTCDARPLADADVALLGITCSDAQNKSAISRLKRAGLQVIALSRAGADAARYRELVSGALELPPDDARPFPEEWYTRLKYQIRNARLARAVEKGGFSGTWRAFPAEKPRPAAPAFRHSEIRLIAIGASAGGTQALLELIPALPPDMPAIALVQHMPEAFVPLFAAHLREKCQMRVCLAEGGERVEPGAVYLTALDRHLTVVSRGDETYIACEEGGNRAIRPSVDQLFSSAAGALGPRAIGVILTGMGADGAKGLLDMRRAGAYTIGQDEGSCVVYGMPQAAYQMDAVEKQLPLNQIARALQMRAFPRERSRNDAERG